MHSFPLQPTVFTFSFLCLGSTTHLYGRNRRQKRKSTHGGPSSSPTQNPPLLPPPTTIVDSTTAYMITNLGYHNLSKTRVLSPEESTVLSLGLSFVPTPASLNDDEIIAHFSKFKRSVRIKKWLLTVPPFLKRTNVPIKGRKPSSFQPPLASPAIEQYLLESERKLLNILTNKPLEDSKKRMINYPDHFKKTISNLRDDNSIVVCSSDKNLGLCIVDRSWYHDAAMSHLSDNNSYTMITQMIEFVEIFNTLRKILDSYSLLYLDLNRNSFSPLAAYLLTIEDTPKQRLCKFYLLIKIHKSPISTRPISSNTNYLSWHTSKWLDMELKPFMTSTPSYIKNSQSLIKILEKRRFPSTSFLLEADVDNLYPSIPVADGIFRLATFLRGTNMSSHRRNLIVDLAQWILNNNYCSFDGNTYKQIKGTAMGTPFAVAYACIYLTSIENEVYSLITTASNTPIFYKRYIDDIFAIFTNENAANSFVQVFNSISPSIHLTAKVNGREATFLDVTLFKGERFISNNTLDVKLFQKPINKYVYLPPTSFHSKNTFKAIILGELRRYRINCSNDDDYKHVKDLFFNRLCERGHKATDINHTFDTHFDRNSLLNSVDSSESSTTAQHTNAIFCIPRTPRSLSLELRQCLKYPQYIYNDPHAESIFHGDSPTISFKGTLNLGNLLANRF